MPWPRTQHARILVTAALVLAPILALAVHADQQEGGGQVLVAEGRLGRSAGLQYLSDLGQAVTALADGGFAVIWEELTAAHDENIRMQWLTAEGDRRFGKRGKLVAGKKRQDERRPVIVANQSGGAFAAYDSDFKVYVQRFHATGRALWPGRGVRVVKGPRSHTHHDPNLLVDRDGGVFVCLGFSARFEINRGILCQRFDADGNRLWGRRGRIAGTMDGKQLNPRLVPDGDGGLYVFWRNQHFTENGEEILIQGQRFAPDGSRLWSDEGLLIRNTNVAGIRGGGIHLVGAVPDGSGGAIVVFHDRLKGESPNLDVVGQRLRPDGSFRWKDPARIVVRQSHHQFRSVVADRDGGAYVIVSDGLFRDDQLYAYRLGPNGEHVWSRRGIRLSDESADGVGYPAFAVFDGRTLQVGWTERSGPHDFSADIKFARLDTEGNRLDSPGGVFLTDAREAQYLEGLAYSPLTGTSLAVWNDFRGQGTPAGWDVYGALVSAVD